MLGRMDEGGARPSGGYGAENRAASSTQDFDEPVPPPPPAAGGYDDDIPF
jgi:hypothetical protein